MAESDKGPTEIPESVFRQSAVYRDFQRTRMQVRAEQAADRLKSANTPAELLLANMENLTGLPLLTPFRIAAVLLLAAIVLPLVWALAR